MIKKDVIHLWNYLSSPEKLIYADYLLIMGCNELNFVRYAAELYKQGYARKIVATGGNMVDNMLESRKIVHLLCDHGIDEQDILVEEKAKNTFENLEFSKRLFKSGERILIVHRPFCKMRAYHTALKVLADYQVGIWSPHYAFDEYVKLYHSSDRLINLLVGELYRMIMYPKLGFFGQVIIPGDVIRSYNNLVSVGYTDNLIDLSSFIKE